MDIFAGAMTFANNCGVGIMGQLIGLPNGQTIEATKDPFGVNLANTAGGVTANNDGVLYVRVEDALAKGVVQGMIVTTNGDRARIAKIAKVDSYYGLTLGPVDAASGAVSFLQ